MREREILVVGLSILATYLCVKRVTRLYEMKLEYVEPMQHISENMTETVSYFDESTIALANGKSLYEIKFSSNSQSPDLISNITMKHHILAIHHIKGQDVTFILTKDLVLTRKQRGENAKFEWQTNVSLSLPTSAASLRSYTFNDRKSFVIVAVTYIDDTTRVIMLDASTGNIIWDRNRNDDNNHNNNNNNNLPIINEIFKHQTSLQIFSRKSTRKHEIHVINQELPLFIVRTGKRVWGLDILSGQTLLYLDRTRQQEDDNSVIEEIHLTTNDSNSVIEEVQLVRFLKEAITPKKKRKNSRICPLHVRISQYHEEYNYEEEQQHVREFPLCTRSDRKVATPHVLPQLVITKQRQHDLLQIHVFRTSRGLIQSFDLNTGLHVRTTRCESVTWSIEGANQFPMSVSEALTISPSRLHMIARGEHAICILDIHSGYVVARTLVPGFTSLSRPVHYLSNDNFSLLTTVGLAGFSVTSNSILQSLGKSDWFVLCLVLMTWCCVVFLVSKKKSSHADSGSRSDKKNKLF